MAVKDEIYPIDGCGQSDFSHPWVPGRKKIRSLAVGDGITFTSGVRSRYLCHLYWSWVRNLAIPGCRG